MPRWPEHYKADRKKNKQKYLDKIRLLVQGAKSVPCVRCGGGVFPAVCMDFHHRDPATKLFDVGDTSAKGRGSRGIAAVLDEIAKCDVYCANCHRILSYLN